MFQRILVPLDGSICAEQALPVAKRLAQASHGELILLRVISSDQFLPSLRIPKILTASQQHAEVYLTALSASLDYPDVATHILQGPAAPTIISSIETLGADIVVMSSHGTSGARRWVIGSVANKVLRAAPIPVLVLRDDQAFPAQSPSGTARPLRVLVTLDGSAYAKAALEPAAQLAAALSYPLQGALHLLRVIKPGAAFDATKEIYLQKEVYSFQTAKKYLSRIATHLQEGFTAPTVAKQGVNITWSVVEDNDVAQAILNTAEGGANHGKAEGYDMIAISSHGRGGLARLTMGSIADRVLNASRLPLLVVHPPLTSNQKGSKVQTATVLQHSYS